MEKDLKVMAKFTTNLKNIVSSTFLIGALALSGCGGVAAAIAVKTKVRRLR